MPAITHPGHRIEELPIGRTKIHALLNSGELHARKAGGCTIVVDWLEYLERQPPYIVAKKDVRAASESSVANRAASRRGWARA